ncbi:MAG: hypothetical protein QM640_07285 [Niabella sp.]
MNNYLFKFMLVAIAAISVTACNKNNDTAQADKLSVQSALAVLSDDCTFTDTTVRVYRNATPSSTYSNWTPVSFTLGGVVPLTLEGIYGSFFRPDTASFNNWYIGRLDSTTVCDAWSSLSIEVKNASANLGTAPTGTPNAPYNVLGYDQSISGVDYGLGYYSYDIDTHAMTPQYAIAVWQDSNGSGNQQYESTPSNATTAYIIKVQTISFGTDATGYYSDIAFKYGQAK